MTRGFGGGVILALCFLVVAPLTSDAAPPVTDAAEPSLPRVLARTGEHPGFSRIVFDWLEVVGYRLERDGGQVKIAFDRQADFDLGRLQPQPARWIDAIAVANAADGAVALLNIDEGAKLRHLRVGPKVVVDVYATRRSRARPPAEKTTAAAVETPPPEMVDIQPVGSVDGGIAPDEAQADSVDAAPAVTETPRATARESPAAPVPAPQPPPPGEAPQRVTPQTPPMQSGAWPALRFVWRDATAAAVFRRGGWIWIVFDHPGDDAKPAVIAGGEGGEIERIRHDQATILRIAATTELDPVVERDGFAWVVRPVPSPAVVAEPIVPEIQGDAPVETRLALATESAGAPLSVMDPEIGDTLVIVPLALPGRGVAHGYDYPQFQVLESAQGIVIVPRIDELEVAPASEAVTISGPGGLQVTPVPEAVRNRARLRPPYPLTRVFPVESWPEPLIGDAFVTQERRLRQAVAATPEAGRDAAVLKSAQFYLAQGLAAECLGALAQMDDTAEDNPRAAEIMVRLKLLRGACRLLMNRPREAISDLTATSLAGNDEAALWRAAAEMTRGATPSAARELLRSGAVALDYPHPMRAPLTWLLGEAALAVGDETAARNYIDMLRSDGPGAGDPGHLAYLEGKLRALEGDHEAALGKWSEAEQGNDRWSRARAALARIQAQLKRNGISTAEAIESLETLRYAWRGGAFEFNLLRELARLYGVSGDQRARLLTLRQAATHFPDHSQVGEVAAEMAVAFETLYLQGGADSLTPLSAIALFDEFRELTPAGAKGDEMIRKLADRLVAVDLLDRAALLLEDQVRHRLRGIDQARVGARLALVYLLDRKPEQTLRALEASATPDAPADLARQRQHLEARALAELQRFDEALRFLGDDDSADADLIRADVFGKMRDWERADQVLARLATHAGARPGQPLEDKQARYILNRAVALTLSGNEAGLAKLRQDHGQAMETGPYADAFRLVAAARTDSATDIRSLAVTDVREAEGFQAFLAAYRDRLRQQNLSAIN